MTGLFQMLLLVGATMATTSSCPVCPKHWHGCYKRMLQRIDRVEQDMARIKVQHEQDMARIKAENVRSLTVVDELKNEQEVSERRRGAFNKIKNQATSPAVYFHAHSPQTSTLSFGEIIVYTIEVSNQGGGYNSTTGKFTAPAQGLYMFFMHICTITYKTVFLQIVKKGSVLIASAQYDKDYNTCSSGQTFVQLDAGENVWVRSSRGGYNSYQLFDDWYRWTSFGGALIHN